MNEQNKVIFKLNDLGSFEFGREGVSSAQFR